MRRYFLVIIFAAALVVSGLARAQTDPDTGWTFKPGGRIHLDYSVINADVSGIEWRQGELRRLRLGGSGNYGKRLKYKFELHINGDGEVNLEDGYIELAPGNGVWKIKAGHFKTANSLDEATSSRFMSVLERSAFTDAFEFDRRLGLSLATKGERYTFSAGIFGNNLDTPGGQQGYALAARATLTPIVPTSDTDLLVHLGGSMRYRETGGDQSAMRYRQRPFAHVPGRIISTGRVAESDLFLGAEAAALYRNGWVAGEYGVTLATCAPGAACTGELALSGGYGEVGIMFGGRKTYKGGKFVRPKIDRPITENGLGAIALVARIDTIDLSDAGLAGGRYDNFILGANWWPAPHSRLSVNLFAINAELGTSTSGLDAGFASLVSVGAAREDVSGVMFRLQFDY